MQQDEIMDRYRHLRAISVRHHTAALDYLAGPAILERARHLGLAQGPALVADSEEEMTLVFDLAIHTAKPRRSRAIDRYAKAASLADDADEARVLQAMRGAQFSVWRIDRQHDVAGLMVADLLRHSETWLVDEALATSARPGLAFAGRLCWPADFAMTCGVVVPVDADLLEEVMLEGPMWIRPGEADHWGDDPRFAEAIYRTAIHTGIMDTVGYR